jgi:hypothetical protein
MKEEGGVSTGNSSTEPGKEKPRIARMTRIFRAPQEFWRFSAEQRTVDSRRRFGGSDVAGDKGDEHGGGQEDELGRTTPMTRSPTSDATAERKVPWPTRWRVTSPVRRESSGSRSKITKRILCYTWAALHPGVQVSRPLAIPRGAPGEGSAIRHFHPMPPGRV